MVKENIGDITYIYFCCLKQTPQDDQKLAAETVFVHVSNSEMQVRWEVSQFWPNKALKSQKFLTGALKCVLGYVFY